MHEKVINFLRKLVTNVIMNRADAREGHLFPAEIGDKRYNELR